METESKLFKLEFNEKQQQFYCNYGENIPETYGWVTIFEHCNELQERFFDAYINIKIRKTGTLTVKFLQEKAKECQDLLSQLTDYGFLLTITK